MKTLDRIPFLDLVTPHEELKKELCAVFGTALESGAFVGGPMVEAFEREFAGFCECRYCVGVGNGTDALRFSLIAAGIQPGDIAITVPNTFIATAEAISQAGAIPAFVDVDERTYNMDPAKLRQFLETECAIDARGRLIHRATERRVTGVVPVHLYGQTCDMDAITHLAEIYGLMVIEDACQAHGAEYYSVKENRWRKAGSMGLAAAFSFYPGKNLGACGEAGAVTTGDEGLAQRIRMLRDHGQARKYYHDMQGYNGRLDAIQAGVLRVKLRRLTDWNAMRRQCAQRYAELLKGYSLGLPYEPSWAKAVYHLYVVRMKARDAAQRHLAASSIGTGIHYPVPIHLQKAYRSLGYAEGAFPVAEQAAAEILSLPMFPGLEYSEQSRIADRVLEFVSETRAAPATAALTAG